MTRMWNHGEIPEGISAERSWVEIFVENYVSDGGFYLAEWTEGVANDSIRVIVHWVYYDPSAGTDGIRQPMTLALSRQLPG